MLALPVESDQPRSQPRWSCLWPCMQKRSASPTSISLQKTTKTHTSTDLALFGMGFISKCNGIQLKREQGIDNHMPPVQRQHDFHLMPWFIREGCVGQLLRSLNCVQMHLCVHTLADITTGDGHMVRGFAFNNCPDCYQSSICDDWAAKSSLNRTLAYGPQLSCN